ncbi:sortase domain-bontaining protein [Pimelobacter simplex]|uniref:sortase domain-containing protein n=1 Tax=Nocardioides simplex TaxID=2045 RepID=UPI00382C9A66
MRTSLLRSLLLLVLTLLTPLAAVPLAGGAAAARPAPASPALAPPAPAPPPPVPVAERTPGFVGLTTSRGHELGLARLPGGGHGLCLDTGTRAWPTVATPSRLVRDPVVGYLLATHLDRARRDPVRAAALWWAVGALRGRNSAPATMRAYLAELDRTDGARATRVRRTARGWVRDAVRLAAPRGGYLAPRPVLRPATDPARSGAGTLTGLGLRSARGLPVPGVRVTLHLTGGATFADGRSTRTLVTTTTAPAPISWRRGSAAGPVAVRVRYTGVPAHHYRLHHGTARAQRVATAAGPRTLTASATVPAPVLRTPTLRTQVNLQRAEPGAQLVDAVTVSGLGGSPLPTPLTGEWQLLGPVAPAAGSAPAPPASPTQAPASCRGRDWSRAPVAAGGRFPVAHDGTFSVGATRVTATGCYTYRERLLGSATTVAAPWTAAGLPEETTLVAAAPRLRTLVNHQRATAGVELVDRVVLTGLPTGPAVAPVVPVPGSGSGTGSLTGQWQLLGPVAPDAQGRCTRATWTGAPVLAAGTFPIPLTGEPTTTLLVGRTRITRGGCYTYREALAGSAQSAPVPWTAAGIADETSLVGPRPVAVPQHPRVDTGGSRPASPRPARGTSTVALRRLGLTATLTSVAFRGAALPAPRGARAAGQWTHGAPLDALVGTTVLTGHVSDDSDRPGAFARLRSARRGDVVRVADGAGTIHRWRVTRTWSVDRHRLPRSVFTQDLARRLVLITCTGRVTTPGGGFHYRRNLIVEAVPW